MSTREQVLDSIDRVKRLSPPLPPVYAYDPELPAPIVARLAWADPDEVVTRDFGRFMLVAAGGAGAFAGLLAALVGAGSRSAAAVFAALCLLGLTAGLVLGRRAAHRPNHFTSGEVDRILRHRHLVSFDEWNHSAGPALPREARAAGFAAEITAAIVSSQAWQSDYTEIHRMRLRPAEELRQICLTLRDISDLRRQFGSTPAVGTDASQWWQHGTGQLDSAWESMVDRLAALDEYRRAVDDLAGPLENLRKSEQLEQLCAERLPVVSTHGAQAELAASNVALLGAELVSIRADLQHRMGSPGSG